MRILVTGASGFIGRYLCLKLSEAGHEVIALVRTASIPIPGVSSRIIITDFLCRDCSVNKIEPCDALIHLAGRAHILKDSVPDPLQEFRRVNVELTGQLLRQAADSGVRRFVFVSSIGVNGNNTIDRPFDESNAENPHDLYALSKLEAEQLVYTMAPKLGLDYVIVRPALVFGPEAPGNFGLLLRFARKNFPLPIGKLSARRNLLSVWNLVDFLKACIEHPKAKDQIFLLADEQSVALPDIFKGLRSGMGSKPWIFSMPSAILLLSARLLGMANMFDKLNAELLVDTRKAHDLLSWNQPFTTMDALKKTGQIYGEKNEKSF